ILVVDDEEDVLTYFSTLLQENGYETLLARNGGDALSQLHGSSRQGGASVEDGARPGKAAFDLVLLDITMPSQSGVRVYREMKNDPALRDTPVLIVTGIASDFREFISTRKQVPPPDGYLEKPVEPERLIAEVRRLLERQH
ncbi:MAG: response regulator, partial [Pseudomonadota bacterium]